MTSQINYLKPYDITNVTEGIIVQGCNARGVMGSGVAKAIRNKWPEVYAPYHKYCAGVTNKRLLLGGVSYVDVGDKTIMVANCITQLNYGSDGKAYADAGAIKSALAEVFYYADQLDQPIYMPPIGCGLGGLDWDQDVLPTVTELSERYPKLTINICDI